MKKHLLTLGLITATLTTTTFARNGQNAAPGKERLVITIPMDATVVHKHGTVIPLKQKIKALRPNLNLKKADLVNVTLKAKSKRGRALVHVQEGYFHSREKVVAMSHKVRGFQSPGGFSEVKLRAPREMEGVAWKLLINGKVKVKRIQVALDIPQRKAKQASCNVELQTLFGQTWYTATAEAKGKNKKAAKRKACAKAIKECEGKIAMYSSFIPEITEIVSCVRK